MTAGSESRFGLGLLGGVAIRTGDGADITACVRRRPLALLILLASSGARGVSRDSLIGLLWPDHEPERARNNLSQALHAIRRSLGGDVVVTMGTSVSISRTKLSCDVWQFQDALDRKDLQAAVDAYGGDFAEGFTIPDLDSLERWIESERRHHAAAWRAALRTLATTAGEAGRHEEAVSLWSRFVTGDPLSATGALGLMRALAASGDGAGALEHAREYASLVRRELQVEPDAAVVALTQVLRRERAERESGAGSVEAGAGAELGDRLPVPSGPPGEEGPREHQGGENPRRLERTSAGAGVAPERARRNTHPPQGHEVSVQGASQPAVPRDPRSRRRLGRSLRRTVAIAGLAVAAALATGLVQTGQPGPLSGRAAAVAPNPDQPLTLAVLPFSVVGGHEAEMLGLGMVGLLAASMDGAGDVRSIPPSAIIEVAGRTGGLALGRARRIAAKMGADLFVTGDVVESGGRLRLSAAVWNLERGAQPLARGTVEGELGDILALADKLATQLIADRFRRPGDQFVRVATGSAGSITAVKAYLEGERLFRAGRYAEATDAFAAATAADSAFALAWFRQSVAAEWAGRDSVAGYTAEQALRLRERLSEHNARFIAAYVAWRQGDDTGAEVELRQLAADYPDDPETWLTLGMVLIQGSPLHGKPSTLARPAFERALALDSDNPEALLSLARLAEVAGDRAVADSLMQRLERSSAGGDIARLRAFRASVFGDRPGFKHTTRYLIRHRTALPAGVAADVALRTGDLHAQERFAKALMAIDLTPDLDLTGRKMLARVSLARGRPEAADASLAGRAGGLASRLELRSLAAAMDFLQVEPARVAALREEVRRWDAGTEDRFGTLHTSAHAGLHPHIRLHRIGLLSIRLGDGATARIMADSIEAIPPPPAGAEAAEMLANGVRAHLAFAEGDPGMAIAYLDRGYWPLGADIFESEGYDRLLRADALAALGRPVEALGWYSTLGERSAQEVVFLAPAALRQAEIHDRLGDRDAARVHYQRLVELWQEPEAALRPVVDRVRARLAALDGRTRE